MSGRTKEERDRIKSQKQNAAAKKKKKETGKSSSSSKKKVQQATETAKKAMQSFGKTYGENVKAKAAERKTKNTTVSRDEYDNRVRQSYGERNGLRLPSVFDDPRETPTLSQDDQKTALQNMRTRMEEAEQSEKEKQSSAGDRFSVWNEDRRNPLTKTAVRTPERDVRAGNTGRTREELERRTATRDLAQTTADDWLRLNRSAVALKDSEKAGVGLGTIRHGRMNENADLFTNNWSNIPKEAQVDASIQMIYSNGVNDRNRDMVMQAFNNATTYEKRKIMDAVVQTDGWSDVAYEMRNTINNAPDAEQALMQQISEDMNVRNGNYLDTFERAAGKAIVDQYNLQQKEDKVIADWAKENYDTGEALKYAVEQSVSGWLANAYDAIALAHSDLMQAGQQDDITDGVGAPWRNVKNVQGFGNKVASVGTTVLHDLFRIAGLPISLLSKAIYTPEEVNRITEKLMGVTDWYQEAVRNNQVALEASNLSEGQKTIAEITGTVIDQIPGIVMAVIGTPAAGMTTFGVQAGGKYGRSAYEQGASIEEAVKFGLSAAAAEVATEKLFTGFGYFGKGLSSKVLNDTTRKMIENSAFKNSIAADMLKRVVAGGGEATEEMIMEILTPYLERSTYDPAADGATMEEILRSGGLGFVVAQILGLPANALGVTGNILEKADTRRQEQIVSSQIRDEITAAVERGEISEQDAVNINAQIKDMQSGKGSLMQSEVQEEQKTTGENLDKVYSDFNEAREAMQAEAKGKADGETVTARFMQDGEAKLWTATVVDGAIAQVRKGFTSRSENAKYTAKAAKVAGATNTAERTGYQLNVKDEIVEQVSALSKAFGKEIEFINDNAAVHGYEQDGKIFVNANSSQSPAAAVIAHEMTHLLENTSSYQTLQSMVQNFYKSSLEDKRAEIFSNYKAAGVNLTDEQADYEVMAMFVEEKLLTDYDTIHELTRTDRTLAEKIKDWINKVIQKITGNKEQRFLMDARDMWAKALQEEQSNKKAPEEEIDISLDGANKKYSIESQFKKDIRQIKQNIKDKKPNVFFTDSHLMIGETPEFLGLFGFDTSKPLLMTSGHAKDIMMPKDPNNTQYHGLTAANLINALSEMNDPVLVISSVNSKKEEDGTLMILTTELDADNIPIGIYVYPVGKGNYNRLEISANFVKTAYGKKNISSFIETAVKEDRLLYENKTKSQQLRYTPGVYFPNNIPTVDFKKNIARYREIVKGLSGKQRHSIGRSDDAAYMDAVNRGDMAEAQRMVDEAASAAGYSHKMYHGAKGGGGFTVFRGWQYFTEKKAYAERYAKRDVPESLYSVYVKMERPFDTRDEEAQDIFYDIRDEYGLSELQNDGLPDWTDGYDITDYIEENDLDYDAILLNEGGDLVDGKPVSRGISYVIRDSVQIKSADPVTYDDDGNVIPLSERFRDENDDIRWSIGRSTDSNAERRAAEEADQLYDEQIENVIENAPELTREELREIDNSVTMTKSEMEKELAQLADNYKEGKGRKKKVQRKGAGRELTGKLRIIGKQGGRKIYTDKKKDDERRKLRLEIAKKWHAQNKTKSEPGSAQAMYFKNRSAQKLSDEFRRGIITYLVERDMFIPTESGGVVVDENSAEIAKRDTMTGEWDISFTKNQYVPSAGLTYLAEAEGLDADEFFTMYSKIKFLKEHKKPDGGYQYKRKDIVDYIVSLNLTSKQKWFLYFDVAGYARSTAPAFLGGGRVKEEKGNQRGRMVKALDNIAIDMFAGAMKEPDIYDGSHRITNEDILAFADIVYGKEDSKAKDDFMIFFTGRIISYADEMMKMRAVERTNLLTDNPKEADPYKAKILRIYRNLKKELFAEGEAFERMADKLNNPLIRARYYDAKKSLGIANEMINGKHQRNINGEVIGKGLHEIFKPVFKADEKAKNSNMITELTLLVNCRHDIYRMKYETNYTGYTKEECEAHIERISKAYPMLVNVADELVQYGRNLLQMCVDCGRISEGDYKYFIEKYPYYVPTFRLLNNQYYDRAGNVIRRTNDVLHKVKGGTQPDVLPLFDQMVRRTNEIVKACKKNQLATELAKAYRDPKSAEYIVDIQETMSEEDRESSIDKLGIVEDIGLKRRQENGTDNIIPWYCAGVQNDIIISDENLLYGWDRINYMIKEPEVGKIMRKINSFRRAVLTQYNPTFFLTNHIKDVNDMFLYNQHAERLPKYYALAWKVMVGGKTKDGKNRDYWEEYLSHGMAQTSIFEYDLSNAGRRTKKMKAKSVMMAFPNGFNEINFIVEQVPRLAVYMETVDRLEEQRKNGGNTYTDEEIKTIADYQASDATLNFGRSGTIIKNMNTYGCTFLNAGVQGMDRFRRMFTQIKDGNKQAIIINVFGLVMKSIMLGLGSNWILDWIFGGDDEFAKWIREKLYEDDADRIKQEYLEMADYQRLNYFLFAWPFGEQEIWIRIPRGRVAAYMYSWAYNGEKVYSGEMDWMDLLQTQWDMAKDTILPPNFVYENIIGPFLDVARNKDAWGEEIVTSYEDQSKGYNYLEYDEDTTDMAIMLADFAHRITADEDTGMSRLDISPKKLDYIVEQYLGSYADLIMPMMNKDFDIKAGIPNGLSTLLKKFYIDPTLSNRLAGDYYDLSDLYQGVAEAYEEDTPYAVSSEIFITVNTQLKPLREASKEVSKTTSMTKGKAYDYLDDLEAQAAMNGTSTDLIEEFREELRSDGNNRGELSRKQILELNKVIKDQMNQLYRTGTADAKALQEYASANYYGKDGNTDLYKEWYRNNKSAEWQIIKITATSDSAKENWDEYSAMGGDAQSFVDFYNYHSMTNSTYDKDGDSVKGQGKKDKCVNFLHNLDVSADLKKQLYLSIGGWSEKKMPRFTDGSKGTMDIALDLSHPLGEAGEVSLSFMVDNNGHTQISVDPGTAVGAAMVGSVEKIVRSEKYGDSIFIKSTDKNGNTVIIQYYGLEEVGGNHEGGVKKYDYIEAGDMIGKVGKDGLKFKVTVNGKPVDAADYLELGTPSTINSEGYTTTKIGEEERDDEKVASSGSYSGYRGGGGGGRSASLASSAGNFSGGNGYRGSSSSGQGTGGGSSSSGQGTGGGSSSSVVGRSTNAEGYGSGGLMLPRANGYNPIYLPRYGEGSSLATTQTTPRTGLSAQTRVTNTTLRTPETWRTKGSLWDENILS